MRVLDIATLFAGPFAAVLLADYGAEVIKVEHPRGDPARTHGHSKAGTSLWWKSIGRNKRCVTLDLSHPRGQEILRGLIHSTDVVIENFRPNTLERWARSRDVVFELTA